MKTRKSTRSLLALVLILSMLLSCAGFTAFAQVTTPVNVEASGDGNEKEETVADDIQVTDPADISAVTVKADTGAEAELEVQGNISAESTGGDATAAEIAATDGGKAEFEVQGDVEATAPNGEATGIGAEALIGGASAEISVTGNVTATGDQAVGIEDRIDTKASLDISVDGDVKAVGDSSAIGVGLPIFAGSPNPEANETEVHVTGSVSAESPGTATGVHIFADGNTEASVKVDQDVSTAGTIRAIGVEVMAEGASADITVGGDVKAQADDHSDENGAYGIVAETEDQGETKVKVQGEVKVEGYGHGIYVNTRGDSETEVEVKGPVTVTGEVYVAGLTMIAAEGSAEVNTGAITVSAEAYHDASAINISNQGGEAKVQVNGDVESNGFGINVSMIHHGKGTNEVIVDGDVNAGIYAVQAVTQEDSHVVSDILVDGTIHADAHPIVVNEATTEENLKITVWKIDLDEDGDVVKSKDDVPGAEIKATENSREMEESIMYIIRVEQPEEGGTLKPVREDGSDLDQSHGKPVAKEGETVLMKVDLASGYRVTGAYSVDGQELNIFEQNGQYFVEVPKGGGVWIGARLERGGDGGDWYPGAAWTNGIQYVDVKFEFNGGHRLASLFTGPVVKRVPVGTSVVLIDAPVKEGTDFLGWISDKEDVTVTKPGQNFRAMEDVVFTASWSDDPVPAAEKGNVALTEAIEPSEIVTAATDEQLPDETVPAAEAPVTDENAVDDQTETEEAANAADVEGDVMKAEEAVAEAEEPAVETETPAANAEKDAVKIEEMAAKPDADEKNAALSLGDSGTAALSLGSLMGASGSGLSAKLIVDLGGGNALEIPVNIQLSFGEATIVTT